MKNKLIILAFGLLTTSCTDLFSLGPNAPNSSASFYFTDYYGDTTMHLVSSFFPFAKDEYRIDTYKVTSDEFSYRVNRQIYYGGINIKNGEITGITLISHEYIKSDNIHKLTTVMSIEKLEGGLAVVKVYGDNKNTPNSFVYDTFYVGKVRNLVEKNLNKKMTVVLDVSSSIPSVEAIDLL